MDSQNGWSPNSIDADVTTNPVAAENQVLEIGENGVLASKALSIADGGTGTLYFRFWRDGSVNISAGASDVQNPGRTWADFETQINNQNDNTLKVRDGGSFDDFYLAPGENLAWGKITPSTPRRGRRWDRGRRLRGPSHS